MALRVVQWATGSVGVAAIKGVLEHPDLELVGCWVHSADKAGNVVGRDDFDAQCVQVFANLEAALASQGAGWKNIVQFTTYLVHSQDIPKFMAYRLREFPRLFPDGAYPPNTLLMVDRLVQEPFLVEVQAIAAL